MADVSSRPPRFDRVARIYRAMEYLSFGPLLERCRFFHLPSLQAARRALILGDGDGRFTARLLATHRGIRAHAIDASSAMLHLLQARVASRGAANRLTVLCADARSAASSASGCDLVVTHFFLDCLTPDETEALIARVRPFLTPEARWLVSEFAIPPRGRIRRGFSRAAIASLYAAFRLLTGLAVRAIPPWRELLGRSGFTCTASHSWLGGLLVTELWQLPRATASARAPSHPAVDVSRHPAPHADSIPGIDPGPRPAPFPPPAPEPEPEPEPDPEPDPEPWPDPLPRPQPVTRGAEA
jgi:ubiquinone/menaquinone biosynthesis C-methylase UbiE